MKRSVRRLRVQEHIDEWRCRNDFTLEGCRLKETMVRREYKYKGRVVSLRVDGVRLHNGREVTREVVEHPGAVAILAHPELDRVLLVRQFRYPLGEELLEIPAGKLDPGEAPDAAAARELREETGYRARQMEWLMTFYSTPGFSDERLHLYRATDLTVGYAQPDDDEFVECGEYSREEVEAMIGAGRLHDAKTLIALLWWLGRA